MNVLRRSPRVPRFLPTRIYLLTGIDQSRFVLVGEGHGLSQNPALSAAMWNAVGRDRFHAMAIEQGPLVASELEGWARRHDGFAQLAAFERALFAANYTRAATASAAPPKVLVKLGGYHVYRGLNPVRGSGVGNCIAEFAEGQGAQSLHIRLMAVEGWQPIHPKIRSARAVPALQPRRRPTRGPPPAAAEQSLAVRLDLVRSTSAAEGLQRDNRRDKSRTRDAGLRHRDAGDGSGSGTFDRDS
jgi:hypothetical protein